MLSIFHDNDYERGGRDKSMTQTESRLKMEINASHGDSARPDWAKRIHQ